MIKAAFFDIDGTLLSFTTHRVSAGTIRAFDRLHRAGVRTFLSTGRPEVLIPKMPVTFEAKITMNGGLVFTSNEVLFSNPIPNKELQSWLDIAKDKHLCTMIQSIAKILQIRLYLCFRFNSCSCVRQSVYLYYDWVSIDTSIAFYAQTVKTISRLQNSYF